MPYYVTCPYCGAHNDPGEKCTCQEENEPELITDKPELITDKPELITDKPELITDKPELVPDKTEIITIKGKNNKEIKIEAQSYKLF